MACGFSNYNATASSVLGCLISRSPVPPRPMRPARLSAPTKTHALRLAARFPSRNCPIRTATRKEAGTPATSPMPKTGNIQVLRPTYANSPINAPNSTSMMTRQPDIKNGAGAEDQKLPEGDICIALLITIRWVQQGKVPLYSGVASSGSMSSLTINSEFRCRRSPALDRANYQSPIARGWVFRR